MTQLSQTGYKKDIVGSYITKDPAASLQYSVDWSDWIPSGDSIQSAAFVQESTHTAANLNIGGVSTVTNVASATISSGAAGEIYTVKNTITTTGGFTDVRRFRIQVEKRYV